jgi:ABC-type amino acid transport substrate-binding protein
VKRAAAGLLGLLALGTGQAAEHEGLQAVRERGALRVCADPSNPPFSSDDPATPGFEVELARLIARELGVDAQFRWNLTYVRALRPLREGACELFMGLPRDERFREGHPWIAVSRPYYMMRHGIVARADAGVRAVGDLAGGRVAIEGTSVADFYVFDKGIERSIFRSQQEAFAAVVSGEVRAALLWLPVGRWLARGKPDLRVTPVSDPRLDFEVGAGVRRRERDLAAAVDAAVGRIMASGKGQEILTRYGAVPGPGARRDRGWLVLAEARDAVDLGRSLFSTSCSRCHGAEGAGGGQDGTVPTLRNYAGGPERFMRMVRDGRRGTPMGGFKAILTEEEIRAVYAYLTSFPRQ